MNKLIIHTMNSAKYRLRIEDLKRILRDLALGTLAAIASAVIISLPDFQIWAIDFIANHENLAPFFVPMLTTIIISSIGTFRRFLTDYSKK